MTLWQTTVVRFPNPLAPGHQDTCQLGNPTRGLGCRCINPPTWPQNPLLWSLNSRPEKYFPTVKFIHHKVHACKTQIFPPQVFQSSWGSLWSLEAFLLSSSSGETCPACQWSLKSQNHSHSTTSYFPHPHYLALQGFCGRDDQGGDPFEGRLHSHRGLDPPTSQTSSQGCWLLIIKYGFISNVIDNHRH